MRLNFNLRHNLLFFSTLLIFLAISSGVFAQINYTKLYEGKIENMYVTFILTVRDTQASAIVHHETGEIYMVGNVVKNRKELKMEVMDLETGATKESMTAEILPEELRILWQAVDAKYLVPYVLKERKADAQKGHLVFESIEYADERIFRASKKELGTCSGSTKFQCLLPRLPSNPTLDKILQSNWRKVNGLAQAGSMQAAIKKYSDDFLKEFIEVNTPSEDFLANYSQEADHTVLYNDKNILTMGVFVSSYTGGAHGNYSSVFYNWDLKTGQELLLEHVIDTLKNSALSKIITQNYKIQNPDLAEMVFEDIKEIGPNENFFVTNEALFFFYNTYEIAPYAAGPSSVKISWKELKPFLHPNSPFLRFVSPN
ncbi:MAG: DUF3298/DUF4163 domain-containing protein [Cytophagales bacterium]|nr:MAG: DUF3298/DUF4163 domain-containing protein [Cytophagales bacterium]TAF62460.1 MAG: DUF3298/DUF4163 domain-containing protein [Cytophagales bacterium]